MEALLAVLRPKQHAPASPDFRARVYDILLLDVQGSSQDWHKAERQLPKVSISYEDERTNLLQGYLFNITGGNSGGLKGRMIFALLQSFLS